MAVDLIPASSRATSIAMSKHPTSGPCHRCGRSGHLARECSLHVCFRCNGRGHMAWECFDGVTCSRCGEKGHLQRNCKNVSCHKCGRKGHISKFCNDPFIKAEEVERNERHQAFLNSRITSDRGSGKGGYVSAARAVSDPMGNRKVGPGPWDGLGDPGQDRTLPETQISDVGNTISKAGATRSQSGILVNVKILTVKRKIYPEANRLDAKRRPREIWGDLETDIGGDPKERSPCKDTLKSEEPLQWNGLLGYASDDSLEACEGSFDKGNKDQNCNLEEHIHMKLDVDSRDSPGVGNCDKYRRPQFSLDQVSPRVDEGNGFNTGLQSSEQLDVSSIVETNGPATSNFPNVQEEALERAVPNFAKDVLLQANISDSLA